MFRSWKNTLRGEGDPQGSPFTLNIKGIFFLRWLGINAIVLYPFVFYAQRKLNPIIQKHEEIHLQQIKYYGVGKFYTRYLLEYVANRKRGLSHYRAYREISFEKEAYAHQTDKNYQVS